MTHAMTPELAQAEHLHQQWRAAYDRYSASPTDARSAREQATHDALVDHLEATDLNRCQFDPRNTAEDDDRNHCGYCGAIESDDCAIMFDMLSGEHRCDQHFPWDHTDDGEVPDRSM